MLKRKRKAGLGNGLQVWPDRKRLLWNALHNNDPGETITSETLTSLMNYATHRMPVSKFGFSLRYAEHYNMQTNYVESVKWSYYALRSRLQFGSFFNYSYRKGDFPELAYMLEAIRKDYSDKNGGYYRLLTKNTDNIACKKLKEELKKPWVTFQKRKNK